MPEEPNPTSPCCCSRSLIREVSRRRLCWTVRADDGLLLPAPAAAMAGSSSMPSLTSVESWERRPAAAACVPLAAVARPRFWSRKVACSVCHLSKKRCDGGRPCSRCVRLRHSAECVDRPSARAKRQRQQSITEEQSAALCLSAVVHCHSTLVPAEPGPLSQCLLAAHRRSLARLRLAGASSDSLALELREKLLGWAWHRQMMLPADVEAVAHSVVPARAASTGTTTRCCQPPWPLWPRSGAQYGALLR